MSSSKKGQIESAKIVIGEVFSRFWFRIPDYQRAYVWGKDEISELIDDVNYASEHNPEGHYFLGSMVLRKATRTTDGVSFEEYELLDGQQRLTTLMLMLACIRDRVTDDKLKAACREMLFQEENKWKKIPGRNRIVYDIRDNVGTFIESYIKTDGGSHSPDLVGIAASKNLSLSNMAAGLQTIHASIDDTTRFPSEADFDRFVGYLELVPEVRLRYTDRFDDPNLPGEMITTITLKPVSCGTELTAVQEGIPDVIPEESCYLGWQESLALLAKLVEAEIPG